MTIKAIPDIIRALEFARAEYALLKRRVDLLTATLVSVADGETLPEDLHAFRRQHQIEMRYTETDHAHD
jgi:hypothetical protein